MPREKTRYKFRCIEAACGNIVRSDKWTEHCRNKHAFKFARQMPIQYKVIEMQHKDGPWTPCNPAEAKVELDSSARSVTTAPESTDCMSSSAESRSLSPSVMPVRETVLSEIRTNHSSIDTETSLSNVNISISNAVSEVSEGDNFNLSANDVSQTSLVETLVSNDDSNADTVTPVMVVMSLDQQPDKNIDEHISSETLVSTINDLLSTEHQPDKNIDESVTGELNDPALYRDKRVTAAVISQLVNSPCQPNDDYTFKQTNRRSFVRDWFKSEQLDGTSKPRTWLSYSMSTDSAYCTTCLLFGGPSADSLWTHTGYTGWHSHHGLRGIENHESSKSHRSAEVIRFQWMSNCTVDKLLTSQNKTIVEQNRRVMYVAVKVMKYLATEMMAVRGHKSQDGNFMHLFKEFSEYDTFAAGYLTSLQDIRQRDNRHKPDLNFLSPLNCRRLLVTMKNLVVKEICKRVSEQKTFSMINDGTQDLSKKDAQAVLLRYIEVTEGIPRPVERLIEVFTTGDSSGQGLYDRIKVIFDELKLNFEWIIGQSYDGAGNMSGKYSGLQSRILELSKKALYIWCQAHRLNLVVEGVIGSSAMVNGTLGLLQEVYNFFNGFRRHDALAAAQHNEDCARTLKRVSDTTRTWRSAEDGVNVILDCYDAVLTALENLEVSPGSDAATVSSANGLLKRLQDFGFIVCLFMLRSIFRITGPVSRLLQGVACDFAVAASLIQGCIEQFRKQRELVDEHWTELLKQASIFAVKHDIEPSFAVKRPRRVKCMPGEQLRDERIQDPEKSFKVHAYIPALDKLLSQFKDRFTDNTIDIMKEMQYFSPADLLAAKADIVASQVKALCTFYGLQAKVVARELNEFRPLYQKMHTLVSVADIMPDANSKLPDMEGESGDESCDEVHCGRSHATSSKWANHGFLKPLRCLMELSGFHVLTRLYKILVTLAITSSSAERAMSRVRIIKNRLRTTMLDDWFSSMMILASEKDILQTLPADLIIDHFAMCSTKLQKQLII